MPVASQCHMLPRLETELFLPSLASSESLHFQSLGFRDAHSQFKESALCFLILTPTLTLVLSIQSGPLKIMLLVAAVPLGAESVCTCSRGLPLRGLSSHLKRCFEC